MTVLLTEFTGPRALDGCFRSWRFSVPWWIYEFNWVLNSQQKTFLGWFDFSIQGLHLSYWIGFKCSVWIGKSCHWGIFAISPLMQTLQSSKRYFFGTEKKTWWTNWSMWSFTWGQKNQVWYWAKSQFGAMCK